MTAAPLALAFDLDGTITDSIETCILAVQRAYELTDLEPPSREHLVPGIGRPLVASLPPLLRSESLAVDEYLPVLIANYVTAYPELSRRHTSVFPGMAEVARHLSRRHTLGIVTSKATETAADTLDQVGLSDCFTTVIGSDMTVALKPDPAPLLALCQRLAVSPVDVVMFGDADVDMQMASDAGAVGIGVTWGSASAEQLWEAGAHAVISSPEAVLPALARLMEERSAG